MATHAGDEGSPQHRHHHPSQEYCCRSGDNLIYRGTPTSRLLSLGKTKGQRRLRANQRRAGLVKPRRPKRLPPAPRPGVRRCQDGRRSPTGVTIDHHADRAAPVSALIADALGGVDVCLQEPVYEPLSGADFPKQAASSVTKRSSFVRQRHDLPAATWTSGTSAGGDGGVGPPGASRTDISRHAEAVGAEPWRSVVLSSGWDSWISSANY